MSHYADDQETAAQDLRALLTTQGLPSQAGLARALTCRDLLWSALADRMGHLGHPVPVAVSRRTAEAPVPLSVLHDDSPRLLARVIASQPRLPEDQHLRPSDALGDRDEDLVTALWASAATRLIAANHSLQTAEDQPWRRDAGAAWYLLGDTAETVEALLLLDQALVSAGLLDAQPPPQSAPLPATEARIIARHCSQAARWYGTSSVADLAHPAGDVDLEDRDLGVRLVRKPEDLAAGLRRLADRLHPLSDKTAAASFEPRHNAWSIKALAVNQLHTVRVLHESAAGVPDLARHLEESHGLLRTVAQHASQLVDVDQAADVRPHPAFGQQQEITTALRRMGPAPLRGLTVLQLTDAAMASHAALTNYARATRREVQRNDTTVRRADPGKVVGLTREHHRSPFSNALTKLMHQPPPVIEPTRWPRASERDALRETLTQTPLTPRAPSPYLHQPPATRLPPRGPRPS